MAEVAVKSAKAQIVETGKKAPISSKATPELSQSVDSPVEQVLHLQRAIGNRTVSRLIQSGHLQAKLLIQSKKEEKGKVYVCGRPIKDTKYIYSHAFFRIGGKNPGNPTYSLIPLNIKKQTGSDCWQGVYIYNYGADRNYKSAGCEPTKLNSQCVIRESSKYPKGYYCMSGPNSNTFVGFIAKQCGLDNINPPGVTPGLKSDPPPKETCEPYPRLCSLFLGSPRKLKKEKKGNRRKKRSWMKEIEKVFKWIGIKIRYMR